MTPSAGLSRAEVAARLATDGPNRLPPPERQPAWQRLVGEMVHFFALMLWIAGVLAFSSSAMAAARMINSEARGIGTRPAPDTH